MTTETIEQTTTESPSAQSVYLREKVFANRDEIKRLMDDFGAYNVRIFGSVAQGTANEKSDIDLLADKTFECDASLFDYCGLVADLENLIGHKTDLLLSDDLKERVAVHIFANELIQVC